MADGKIMVENPLQRNRIPLSWKKSVKEPLLKYPATHYDNAARAICLGIKTPMALLANLKKLPLKF